MLRDRCADVSGSVNKAPGFGVQVTVRICKFSVSVEINTCPLQGNAGIIDQQGTSAR